MNMAFSLGIWILPLKTITAYGLKSSSCLSCNLKVFFTGYVSFRYRTTILGPLIKYKIIPSSKLIL